MTKKRIVIDIEGGVVQNIYTPEGSNVEVEIRDWDCGSECTDCGKYTDEDSSFTKFVADVDVWPSPHGLKEEYRICPDCAERRGIAPGQQYIRVTPTNMLERVIESKPLDEDERWLRLSDIVHELKSNEGMDVNNGGVIAQIKYFLECGITPDQLEEML